MAKFVQSLEQPHPKRPFTSFLEDTIDQVPLNDSISSRQTLKRYCSESVVSYITKWLDSTSESGTVLDHSSSSRSPESLPNMNSRDPEFFLVGRSPSRSSRGSLVENPLYRSAHLASNNIYLRARREQFPEHVASLVDFIGRGRNSPCPSVNGVLEDKALRDLGMGTSENNVQAYFQTEILPRSTSPLLRAERFPMARSTVPAVESQYKISNPMPDLLFGYHRSEAFTQAQQKLFNSMGNDMVANHQDVIHPFFLVEFKADGPSGTGSLWVGTNQCLGGSASCVNIAERLNRRLAQSGIDEHRAQPINSAVFSIAMSGTEARLFVSWKHDELEYYMACIDSFCLQRPEHFLEFRKYVLNIVDWGKTERLDDIKGALDVLIKEGRA